MTTYYEGLPIYKAAADLVVRLDASVRRLSRYHKYAIGAEMRRAALDVALLVARANERRRREETLTVLCARIEGLKVLVNLGKEVRAFESFEGFMYVMEQVVNLARQAEGWRRASTKAGPELRSSAP